MFHVSVSTFKAYVDFQDKLVKFNPNVLPPQRQFFYQLLDIEMDEVQELIHANDGEVIKPMCLCSNVTL